MTPAAKVITVFGSSRPKAGDLRYVEAQSLGAALAAKGWIVCSGGYGGVMEAVSRGAREAGGGTVGVTTEFFSRTANRWIDDQVRVRSWQDRLFELIHRGDGYVACPGGSGTLAELAVVLEMLSNGAISRKPFVSLGDFWQPVIGLLRDSEPYKFPTLGDGSKTLIQTVTSAAEAAEYLAASFRAAQTAER